LFPTSRIGKKAVSEIVAALLLVAIVMSAATALYFYSSGLLGSLQGGAPQTPLTTHLSIDYYDWTDLTSITIALRNTGTDNVNLTSTDYFLLNSTWSGKLLSSSISRGTDCSGGILNVQTSCKLTIDLNSPPAIHAIRGIAYTLRLITTKGATFNYGCVPGSVTS
jgi:flagellin-like protein